MMMTKARPEEENADTSLKPPASKPSNAVEDLERRLEMLGGTQDPPPPFEAAGLTPAFAAPAAAAPAPAAMSSNKTGKNALLARIMAAQERAKQVQKAPPPLLPPPAEKIDLLSGGDIPPPVYDSKLAPPPAFDASALPAPVDVAPPPFEAVQNSVMSATMVDLPPPRAKSPPPALAAPPMPSAPAFEDLLDASSQQTPAVTTPLPPPPLPTEEAPPAVEDFAGLEGMSEEERNALIEEQRQIMEQIERQKKGDKASEAVARAEAFDQRSNAAVAAAVDRPNNQRTVNLGSGQEAALHGQDRTQQGINEVSPVDAASFGMTTEEAAQMEADRKMAEQLQNEEYKKAGRESERESAAAARQQPQQQERSSGWMEWLGLASDTKTTPVRPTQRPPRPPQRGELGVARPPGALSPARTGEESGVETITFAGSGSYDEQDGLLNSGGTRQAARVAEQKPLFACVADSISTAATSLSTAIQTQTLHEDKEGNIHGVDASSLLAVTQASRENTQGYEGIRNDEH